MRAMITRAFPELQIAVWVMCGEENVLPALGPLVRVSECTCIQSETVQAVQLEERHSRAAHPGMPRRPQAQQAKRQRSAAIADSRRLGRALEGCHLCITSPRRPKHLTLAIGQASYLMLPARCPPSPRPPGPFSPALPACTPHQLPSSHPPLLWTAQCTEVHVSEQCLVQWFMTSSQAEEMLYRIFDWTPRCETCAHESVAAPNNSSSTSLLTTAEHSRHHRLADIA